MHNKTIIEKHEKDFADICVCVCVCTRLSLCHAALFFFKANNIF